jgi:hypothetical protein
MISLEFLKTHSKWVACVAALVLAFAAGRYARPSHSDTIKKDETISLNKTKTEEKNTDKVAKTEASDTIKKHTATTVTKKDGTKVETETDTVEVKQVEKQVETKTVDKIIDRIVYQDRIQFQEKIVDNAKARVHVGPDVTVNVLDAIHGNPAFTFGAHVEVRALGPVWVGVHANTRGAVTLGLSLEF